MTAHLTRIRLSPRSTEAEADARDAGRLHRRLSGLLTDAPAAGATAVGPARLLFRTDRSRNDVLVLAQTAAPMATARLPEGYGRVERLDLGPLLAALATGLVVRYRVLAGPAHPRGGARNRVEAEAWWVSRALAHGLSLRSLVALDRPGPGALRATGPGVLFHGTADVLDAESVRSAVLNGVGRGTELGRGLLSLAPAGARDRVPCPRR